MLCSHSVVKTQLYTVMLSHRSQLHSWFIVLSFSLFMLLICAAIASHQVRGRVAVKGQYYHLFNGYNDYIP